jgi:hypothetical protein
VTDDTKWIIEGLKAWSPMVASGYECPAAASTMNQAADMLAAKDAEIERLCERLGPRGLVVVNIGPAGHYVSEAVAAHIERLTRELSDAKLLAQNDELRRYDRLLEAFTELQTATQKVVDETDRIHDNDPWPIKYRAPYGAIVELRQLLAKQYGLRGVSRDQ